VPAVVDSVVQSRFSVPVTVKVMVEDVDVAADRARVTVVGAVVSMVTDSAVEFAETLPARSVWNATIDQVPAARVPSVQVPPEFSVHVTSDEPALVAFTVPVAPASSAVTDTLIVGVLSVVISSVDDAPVSLDVSRSGNPIATGAVVSITIAFAPAMLSLPDGTAVDVIVLPAVSATVPIMKLDTVRSLVVSPA